MAKPLPQAVPALLAVVLLGGCSGSPPADPGAQAPPPPPQAPAAGTSAPPPQAGKPPSGAPTLGQPAAATTGLVPLPTRRQVIAALPVGRRDPFGSPLPPLPPVPPGAPGAPSAGGAGAAGSVPARSVPGAAGGSLPGGRPSPLTLPPGFRVTGLINSGGTSEAVVEFGALSGSVRPGDRGGRTTDLLPGGWSVAAVDVNRGRVTLQRGQQRVIAEL